MPDTPSIEEVLKQLISLVRQGNEFAQQNIRETRSIQNRLDKHEELTDLVRQAISDVQVIIRELPSIKKTVKRHGVKLKRLDQRVDRLERKVGI